MPNSKPPLEGDTRQLDQDPKDNAPIAAAAGDVGNMATLLWIYHFVVWIHRCTHNPLENPGI